MSGKLDSGVIGDRIDVYEDRVSGWLLRPIRTLLETRDSHFAALSLALSYFEGWAQYRYGEERKHAGGPLHVPLGFPPGFGPSSSLGLG